MRRRKTTQSLVIEGGRVRAIYNERMINLRKIGRIVRAKKISDVRFNPALQMWVSIDRKIRKIVAMDESRKECVRKEQEHYEREIAKGRMPWA